MKKGRNRKKNNPWRRADHPISAGERLRLLALAAVIGLLAWFGARLTPTVDAGEMPSPVVINRVMTSNPSACYPVGDHYCDWVELLNVSDEAVSLAGWRLGDRVDQRGAFELGNVALPPAGSLLVYCAPRPEDYEGDALFSGFRLSANGELLALSDERRRLMQVLEVPAMAAAQVYQRGADGTYRVTAFAKMATNDLRPPFDPDGVIISELMASSRTQLQDEDGDWPDWIELYNDSDKAMDLSGAGLSDDGGHPRRWQFPEGAIIPAKGYVTLLLIEGGRTGIRNGRYCADNVTAEIRARYAQSRPQHLIQYLTPISN